MEKVFITDKQGNKVLPKTHVSAVYDDEGNDLGSHLEAFEDEVRGLVDTPHQEYVTVATYASLPASGSKDTIYRVSNYDGSQSQVAADVYSEYAWDGTQYVFLCVKGAVGEVFDISAYHNNTKYADLNAALTSNTGGVPQSLQKGGMSIKYVQSSDNKYIQYRLMSTTWSTNTENWAIADEGVYVENSEFVYVKTDAEGKLLWAIKADGGIYYGAGCPQQVKDYIEEKLAELSLDEYEDIVTFLNDLEKDDKTLQDLLNEKVDKVIGKSLIQTEVSENVGFVENPEFIDMKTDSEGRILEGITKDGRKEINIPIDTPSLSIESYSNSEWLKVDTDSEGKVLGGRDKSGKLKELVGIETNHLDLSQQGLTDFKRDIGINDEDILYQYPYAQLIPKILNTTKINHNKARKSVFSLLHFSDVHGYYHNMSAITRFMSVYGDYITDVIHSGDSMGMDLTGAMMPEFENTWLNCIGNHDSTIFDGDIYVLQPSLSSYNKVFKDYISNWNVIQPGDVSDDNYDIGTSYPTYAAANGLCYYYKDYTDYKVRMIVVDDNYVEGSPNNHWNAAQKTWFELALNQTLDENSSVYGYHVIVVIHHPPFLIKTDKDNMFQSYDFSLGSGAVAPPEIGECVNDFIEAGGIFICWLSGHLHTDYNGNGLGGGPSIYGYSNQFVISITGSLSPNNLPKYEKSVRLIGTKSQYGMNIMGIDTDNKIIKVLRIGTDIDMYMRRKESFSYSYALDAQHQLVTGIITQN